MSEKGIKSLGIEPSLFLSRDGIIKNRNVITGNLKDLSNQNKKFEEKKYSISLPKIKRNKKMNFYHWSLKDPLIVNEYGIPEPIKKKIVYPNILLVPLVAFDKNLNRIGYGGGFYDRYIKKISKIKKIFTIGLAYSFQQVKKIPVNNYDIKLDYIITEKNN